TGVLDGGQTRVRELHGDRNPFFGGVNPEPIPANMAEALAEMRQGGYDLCVATDGDADRVGIIDEKGRFVTQLQVYALLMRYLIEVRGWKGPVVRSINMTSMADRLGAIYGVPVHEVPVGLKTLAEHAPREVAGVRVERVRDDDGFKFVLADGSWVLLRSSGTEALIRVYAEAASPEEVEARLTALEEIVGIGDKVAHQ